MFIITFNRLLMTLNIYTPTVSLSISIVKTRCMSLLSLITSRMMYNRCDSIITFLKLHKRLCSLFYYDSELIKHVDTVYLLFHPRPCNIKTVSMAGSSGKCPDPHGPHSAAFTRGRVSWRDLLTRRLGYFPQSLGPSTRLVCRNPATIQISDGDQEKL